MRKFLLAGLLFCFAAIAHAAVALPAELVGVWAKAGSQFDGQLLTTGAAIYIDSDGIGGAVGGNGKQVLGVRLVVTAYDPASKTLSLDFTENGKVMVSTTMSFDPAKKLLVSSSEPKETYERRFDSVSAAARKSIGVEIKQE